MMVKSRAERRAAALALLADRPRLSDRAVAAAVGCSPTSVGAWRRQTGHGRAQTGQTDRQPDVGGKGQPDVGRRAKVDAAPRLDKTDYPALGGNVSAESDSPSESDGPVCVECCPCGGEWVSDGEGGRHCQDCGAVSRVIPERRPVLAGAAGELAQALWGCIHLAKSLPGRGDERRETTRLIGVALLSAARWSRP